MFVYEKKLQYPVRIQNPNPALAKFIISQYGGPDGELGASISYLSQRYAMPYPELKALLTDIGTEELGHLEIVATIVHQLTRNMTEEEIKRAGLETYFVDHTAGVYAQFASGTPWTAATFAVKGDVITDLVESMAADGTITNALHKRNQTNKPLKTLGSQKIKCSTSLLKVRYYKDNKMIKCKPSTKNKPQMLCKQYNS